MKEMFVEPKTELGPQQMVQIQMNTDEVLKIMEIGVRKAVEPGYVAGMS